MNQAIVLGCGPSNEKIPKDLSAFQAVICCHEPFHPKCTVVVSGDVRLYKKRESKALEQGLPLVVYIQNYQLKLIPEEEQKLIDFRKPNIQSGLAAIRYAIDEGFSEIVVAGVDYHVSYLAEHKYQRIIMPHLRHFQSQTKSKLFKVDPESRIPFPLWSSS